jgi:hypothetical protein
LEQAQELDYGTSTFYSKSILKPEKENNNNKIEPRVQFFLGTQVELF